MELDLIPTKITSIEQDPSLMVTPEKPPSVLKAKNKRTNLGLKPIPENEHSSICPPQNPKLYNLDPELIVTPEKPQSVLKQKQHIECDPLKKAQGKNKVRFNVPDSSDDTTIDSIPSANVATDCSTTSTDYDEGSSATLMSDDTDFSIKAALYTQRNPLADITSGSNQTSDFLSTSESTGSVTNLSLPNLDSQNPPPVKVVDLRNKITVEKPKSCDIIDVCAQKRLPVYKTKVPLHDKGHRKPTPAQAKIDELTADQDLTKQDESPNTKQAIGKQRFLKKKTGLNRHEHSVKYIIDSTSEDSISNHVLNKPKYNSSLAMGQDLQKIKENKFDPVSAVKKKIHEDDQLKAHVAVKSATGTNIDPEEKLFSNLISLDVPLSDSTDSTEFRRIKRQAYKPGGSGAEPNIFSMFPTNLTQEKVVLDSKCFTLPGLRPQKAPVESVMSLYNYSLCWDALNCT